MMTNKLVRNGMALLLLGTLSALAACGSPPVHRTRTPTATLVPTSTPPPAPTDVSGTGRIPYPWPMQAGQDAAGASIWLPTDLRVYEELETDFLAYWSWSGQDGPASFPFTPDPSQIALLATSDFQGQLQSYSDQIHATGQVTAYLMGPGQPSQAIQTCSQDGLTCQIYYSFLSTTKTTYNAQTGAILAQTTPITLIVLITQSYNKETQRWQLSALVSQEIAG